VLILAAFGAAVFCALAVRRLAGVQGLVASGLFVWLALYGQVVLLAEVLSETHAFSRGGFLAGHALLTLGCGLLWWRAGRPGLGPELRVAFEAGQRAVAARSLLPLFAVGVLGLAGLNAVYALGTPASNGDANSYHLPRAYYWLQLGTARHFPTSDFRLVEFPPNPSFVYAWLMALGGGGAFHLPQATAGLALALAVAGLARATGAGRRAATFSGLVTLTFPLLILEMGSPQTDVLSAATGAASIFFGLRAVRSGEGPDLAGFGLAFGLALGTKLTLFFLLPGLALALVVAAFAEDRALASRRLARAGGAALAGFLALGAYNYVLNLAELGNPIASVRARAVALGGRSVPELATRTTNFLRYGYQILDWPGLARGEGSLLPRLQRRAFEAIARAAGTDLTRGVSFGPVAKSRWLPDEDRSGFGPAGFGVVMVAPILAFVTWRRFRRGGRREALTAVLLVGIGLSWLAGFVLLNQAWTPQKIRYFLTFVPLLCAPVLPFVYDVALLRVPAMLISLAVAGAVTFLGPYGVRRPGPRDPAEAKRLMEDVISSHVERLPRLFPPGARIGVVSEFNDVLFHLFRSLPRHRFVPVAEEDVPALLSSGTLDAALVGQFRSETGQLVTKPGFLLPRNVVVARDAAAVALRLPEPFGVRFLPRGADRLALLLEQAPRSFGADPFPLRLGTGIARAIAPEVRLLLPLLHPSSAERVTASCGGSPVPARLTPEALVLEVPGPCLSSPAPYADLVLSAPGGRVDLKGGAAIVPPRAAGTLLDPFWRQGELPLFGDFLPFVTATGFLDREEYDGGSFRWTSGAATVRLPLHGAPPTGLRVEILGFRGDARLTITVDGRPVFEGVLPNGALLRDLPIRAAGPSITIGLVSDVFVPPGDGRQLGVCVKELTLLR